jgi:site-specific DNA-methyltransferase (adenine-specific)
MDVLATIAENSVDACCTDPPYHLTSIVKRFGGDNAAPAQFGKDGVYSRASSGFMGKQWDGGDIAFRVETWREVYRVLKPGAHLLAFGGTRTFHRMACAIEDAGFEIRDTIQWLYGSGFPKSHDVSKNIDRAAGVAREVLGRKEHPTSADRTGDKSPYQAEQSHLNGASNITAPATDAARQWEGWGTALKPACEPIVLARKPLSERTVASNVLRWGTGAINVDGCRIETVETTERPSGKNADIYGADNRRGMIRGGTNGRWPANVIHDGSDEVVGAFPETQSGYSDGTKSGIQQNVFGKYGPGTFQETYGDEGSAARFFYTAKADSDDRIGSKHPTVKPLDLMQYLVRLITPKGGLVLDPFAGSGTTGEAAFREGMRSVLIECDAEYLKDTERRIELLMAGPDERAFKSQKAKQDGKPIDLGPLFSGVMP